MIDPKLIERLGHPSRSGEEFMFNCPFPHFDTTARMNKPDTKRRLYVNFNKRKFVCYRCHVGGSVSYLYQRLGLAINRRQSLDRFAAKMRELRYAGMMPTTTQDNTVSDKPSGLPDEWVGKLRSRMDAYKYLLGRGLSPELIEDRHIMLGRRKLKGRVVFPSLSIDGVVDYWVARLYVPDPKGRRPRYRNPKTTEDVSRKTKLYWFDRLVGSDLFIAEGVMSALAIGYDATCTFGTTVSVPQIDKLVASDYGTYYVVFDGEYDARRSGLALAQKLYRADKQVRFVMMPDGHDPASISQKELWTRIHNAVIYRPGDDVKILLGDLYDES